MTNKAAAISLRITARQVKRLVARYRRQGPAGLISGKRGKRGNRILPANFTEHAVALVREFYADFGPTDLSGDSRTS